MLSPNAMNRVAVRSPGRTTVTVKLQEAVRCRASVPMHVTLVAPIGKFEPDAGLHATVTGGAPPEAAGVWNVTVTTVPEGESAVTGEGQATRRSFPEGSVELPAHPD